MTDLKPKCPWCGTEMDVLGGPQAQEVYSFWCQTPGCYGREIPAGMDLDTSIWAMNRRPALAPEVVEAVEHAIHWLRGGRPIIGEDYIADQLRTLLPAPQPSDREK